jgi:hypothetical protein
MPLPQTPVFCFALPIGTSCNSQRYLAPCCWFLKFWFVLVAFFSFPFFVFRKFLSTLFLFCSKYLSELRSRLRSFRWRAKFVFWRVSWSLLLPELYSSIWRRCGL